MCIHMCMCTLHLAYNHTQEMLRIMWQQQLPSRGHRNLEDSVPMSSRLGKSVHNFHQELSKHLKTPGMMESSSKTLTVSLKLKTVVSARLFPKL